MRAEDYRPGAPRSVKYCGRKYEGMIVGRYRVSVPRNDYGWDLRAVVRWTTGSGRTHTQELHLVACRPGRFTPEENAFACAVVRELTAAGEQVRLPQRGRDEYYTARQAVQEGLRARRQAAGVAAGPVSPAALLALNGVDYTCGCGLHVHPENPRFNAQAIHCGDCLFKGGDHGQR